MQRERITERLRSSYGSEPEYLWRQYPNAAVFRHPATGRWYGLLMDVAPEKLGLNGDAPVDVMTVKVDPSLVGGLLRTPGFHPAYHMNKSNWVSAELDGRVPDEALLPLLDMAYAMVAPKRKGKSTPPSP